MLRLIFVYASEKNLHLRKKSNAIVISSTLTFYQNCRIDKRLIKKNSQNEADDTQHQLKFFLKITYDCPALDLLRMPSFILGEKPGAILPDSQKF